ncbi:hypothetical protein OBBRIDRAFT_399277 [Obba rivulosa]|uniref:Uncharacterized protein n=1 Tax=Obba rivulosa TaxID=1052685 RepID=A0A8E2AHC5_9APHY|nr:hypothetical protein OBBRIDRAFT_399277 [Obba rivulosa]
MTQPSHTHPLFIPWDDEVDVMPSLFPNPEGEVALRYTYEDLRFRLLLTHLADKMEPSQAPHPIPHTAVLLILSYSRLPQILVREAPVFNDTPIGQHYTGAEQNKTINVLVDAALNHPEAHLQRHPGLQDRVNRRDVGSAIALVPHVIHVPARDVAAFGSHQA